MGCLNAILACRSNLIYYTPPPGKSAWYTPTAHASFCTENLGTLYINIVNQPICVRPTNVQGEYALGWLPLGLGLVMEDEPSELT